MTMTRVAAVEEMIELQGLDGSKLISHDVVVIGILIKGSSKGQVSSGSFKNVRVMSACRCKGIIQ